MLPVILYVQVNFLGNKMIEHPQSRAYKFIIQDAIILRNIMKTVQDGDTTNIPEEAKVSLYSDFNLGQCFVDNFL